MQPEIRTRIVPACGMTTNGANTSMSTTRVNGTDSDFSTRFSPTNSPGKPAKRLSCSSDSVIPLTRWYLPIKWGMEYLLAAVLFLIALPILLIAALLIVCTSKGPIFYLQERVGKHGKTFRVIKLRTMVKNAEGKTGPVWSTLNDPRITPIGKFLRETHIDEFPQLINVLLGQMALMGPRPERPEIVQDLEWKIPNYSSRTNVLPGITGLSQLKLPPDSDLESVRRKQIFDLYYVTHVSAWLDIRILAGTGWLLVCALWQGAYSMISLPPSAHVISSIEGILGPDSDLLVAGRNVPPK